MPHYGARPVRPRQRKLWHPSLSWHSHCLRPQQDVSGFVYCLTQQSAPTLIWDHMTQSLRPLAITTNNTLLLFFSTRPVFASWRACCVLSVVELDPVRKLPQNLRSVLDAYNYTVRSGPSLVPGYYISEWSDLAGKQCHESSVPLYYYRYLENSLKFRS